MRMRRRFAAIDCSIAASPQTSRPVAIASSDVASFVGSAAKLVRAKSVRNPVFLTSETTPVATGTSAVAIGMAAVAIDTAVGAIGTAAVGIVKDAVVIGAARGSDRNDGGSCRNGCGSNWRNWRSHRHGWDTVGTLGVATGTVRLVTAMAGGVTETGPISDVQCLSWRRGDPPEDGTLHGDS